MSYSKINWQNTAATPLNAANLNYMDNGIYQLFTTGTSVVQVVVDPIGGNDATGAFNNESKPYQTMNACLTALPNGAHAEVFCKGNVTASGATRMYASTVIIMAHGSTLAANDTTTLTLATDFKVALHSGAGISFMIDTVWNNAETTNIGDGSTLELFNHRVHTFANSPTSNSYVQNARTSVCDVNLLPTFFFYGVSTSLSLTDTDFQVVTATDLLFDINTGATLNIRNDGALKFNGVTATDSDVTKHFSGFKKSSDNSRIVNALASFEIPVADAQAKSVAQTSADLTILNSIGR